MPNPGTFRQILIGLAIVLLVCAAKNYLAVLVSGTRWCPYLCPSAFEWQFLDTAPPVLEQLFKIQRWLLSSVQSLANPFFTDPWGLTSRLLAAPVIEEFLYRGPLYLTRMHNHRESPQSSSQTGSVGCS